MLAASIGIVVVSALCVYFDAHRRDWTTYGWSAGSWAGAVLLLWSAGSWAGAVLLLWIVFFPYYLWTARKVPKLHREADGGRTDAGEPLYKRCPDCAEQVLNAARVCKHCGYRFDAPPIAGAA